MGVSISHVAVNSGDAGGIKSYQAGDVGERGGITSRTIMAGYDITQTDGGEYAVSKGGEVFHTCPTEQAAIDWINTCSDMAIGRKRLVSYRVHGFKRDDDGVRVSV